MQNYPEAIIRPLALIFLLQHFRKFAKSTRIYMDVVFKSVHIFLMINQILYIYSIVRLSQSHLPLLCVACQRVNSSGVYRS